MFTLTVSGDPLDIWLKIQRINRAVKTRKAIGWKPFQRDETWRYIMRPAASVSGTCPTCKRFGARRTYNGTSIPLNFPLNEKYVGIRMRKPRVHLHKPWLESYCRCRIEWVNPLSTLETRFGKELEALNF